MVVPLNLFISLLLLHRMSETMEACKDTVIIHDGLQIDRIKNYPTFWKLKTYKLHSIMLPGFITRIIRDWIQHEIFSLTSLNKNKTQRLVGMSTA